MANITISVQNLLNAAVYDSYTVSDAVTVYTLKSTIQTAQGYDVDWFDLYFNQILSGSTTLATAGLVNGSVVRINNKIGRLPTLEDRQRAKLDLAALDRAAAGNSRSTYDITELPTQYSGNTIVDNPNVGGLQEGRPWN